MKITRVQARCLKVPIRFPFTETPRTEGMLLAQVETDDGLKGVGMSRDTERFAVRELINREIAPFLVGKDPIETEKIWNNKRLLPETSSLPPPSHDIPYQTPHIPLGILALSLLPVLTRFS
jgi:L-alanine-DL-glutamate epimerase-like enolase superfamily enzyme